MGYTSTVRKCIHIEYPYVLESTFLPCRTYGVEIPYLSIDNLLEICNVSV
jgi:hypothetical protein